VEGKYRTTGTCVKAIANSCCGKCEPWVGKALKLDCEQEKKSFRKEPWNIMPKTGGSWKLVLATLVCCTNFNISPTCMMMAQVERKYLVEINL
jgi:hypothetical protein